MEQQHLQKNLTNNLTQSDLDVKLNLTNNLT